jgi:Flp pilus assembly protein TadD
MNRVLFALLLLGVAGSGAWAQDGINVLDEQHFIQAGDDFIKRGDLDGAAQLFQSAIIYAPRDPVPYHRLGMLYAQNGQSELAHQYYGLALDVQPAYAPALEGLALLDLATGDRAGAEVQRDILMRACGAGCPETAQVERALRGERDSPRP